MDSYATYANLRCTSLLHPEPYVNELRLKIQNFDAGSVNRILNTTPLPDDTLRSLLHIACWSMSHDVVDTMIKNLSYTSGLLGNLLVNEMEMCGMEGGMVRDLLSHESFKTKALDTALRIATEKADSLKNGHQIIETLIGHGAKSISADANG